jgi:hypothetical protein
MSWKQTPAIPARLNNLKSNFIIQIFLDHTIYFYLKVKIHFNGAPSLTRKCEKVTNSTFKLDKHLLGLIKLEIFCQGMLG